MASPHVRSLLREAVNTAAATAMASLDESTANEKARACGIKSFDADVPMIDCPFQKESAEYWAWMDGWKWRWYQKLNVPRGIPLRPVYVMAGNRGQYLHWRRVNNIPLAHSVYVTDAQTLRGILPGCKLLFCGTYYERRDVYDIQDVARMQRMETEYAS